MEKSKKSPDDSVDELDILFADATREEQETLPELDDLPLVLTKDTVVVRKRYVKRG